MKKISKGNIVFALFLVLLIIPTSRNFIQVNLQKLVAKVAPISTIPSEDQITITNYNTSFKGINTPNLSLQDTKGKVLFINFWATWCPPCIAEMPDLQDLHDRYKSNKDIVFAFVSGEKKSVINNFLTKKNYSLPVLQQTSEVPEELAHRSIPTTFIINKNGKIVLHKTGAANWNGKTVTKILDQLLQEE